MTVPEGGRLARAALFALAALRLAVIAAKALLVLVLALAIALIAVCQPWPSAVDGEPFLTRVSQHDLDLEREASRRLGLSDAAPTGLWQLRAVRAQEAWEAIDARYAGGERPRTRVGIYDGFMSTNHPDLAANILPEAPREDPRSVNPKGLFSLSHGTGVMGIIGAAGGRGMTGAAPRAALLPYTTVTSAHDGSMTGALRFFTTHQARVANFAIALPWPLAEQRAVDEAYDAGVLIVTGLYNADTDAPAYPAAHTRTMTASGVGPDDRASGFGRGPLVDVVAPGSGMLTTGLVLRAGPVVFGARYLPLCCNSVASALVTGVAALVLEHDPTLTSAQVEKRIKLSARKVPDMGGAVWHPRYGYGVADAYNAVTFDRRGPAITNLRRLPLGPGILVITGVALDVVDDSGLDPARERDRHLLGVPTSNIARVEYRVGDGPWQGTGFLEARPGTYEGGFSTPVPDRAERVAFRAWDTAGNVGEDVVVDLSRGPAQPDSSPATSSGSE